MIAMIIILSVLLTLCLAIIIRMAVVDCEVIYRRHKMKKRYGQRNYDWLKKYMEEKMSNK